jgi:ABC-type polysaccharide/polyol phosphate transport system ATPase subunit
MQHELAITASGISKRYTLGSGAPTMLSERIGTRLLRRRGAPHMETRGEFWALQDVSLEVGRGEVVGLIGRNGAGKSTFLKILAGISAPTNGEVELRGRVGTLLEVGTGFHPALSGRENVYLSGTIIGMKRREIHRRYHDIVEFAGLERFMETPVKRYSSGMYVRLGFAVAVHLEPEILLVDEVLAVGDAEFQQKCLARMRAFVDEGRTIVFVSHGMGNIERLCRRTYWFDAGRLAMEGPSADVVSEYLKRIGPRQYGGVAVIDVGEDSVEHGVTVRRVTLINEFGDPTDRLGTGEPVRARVEVEAAAPEQRMNLELGLSSPDGVRIVTSRLAGDDGREVLGPGTTTWQVTLDHVLYPGDYRLDVALYKDDARSPVQHLGGTLSFAVDAPMESSDAVGPALGSVRSLGEWSRVD